MNKKYFLIFGIIVAIIIVAVILIGGVGPEEEREKYVITKNPVVINTENSGVPSSPMDLELSISQFSDDRTSEMTVKVSKRTGYKTEWFEAKNTNISIHLPEGLEIPDCPSPQCELTSWRGDVIGDQVKELRIRVNAVKNGEWIIEASALSTDFPSYGYVSDTEKLYILVEDKRVLISDRSFTPTTPGEKAVISFTELVTNPEIYNGSSICTNGIYMSGCESRLLAESFYEENNFTFLTDPKIWVESTDVKKWGCFEGPPCSGPSRIEYPEFCNANVCGVFEYGPSIIQTATFKGDYILKSKPTGNGNGGEPL